VELDFSDELKELQEKDEKQIEYETALKWSRRACAAYVLSLESSETADKLNFFILGEDLRHEAIEHAALYGDAGFLLNELQLEIDKHRKKAIEFVSVSL
jgi:hypothetical protein